MSEDFPIETDVQTLAQLRDSEADFLLLDVREVQEYETAKIDGSMLLPMSEIEDRLGELEDHKAQHIVIHCHHGGRSMKVTQYLRAHGFEKTQNLGGGIDAWSLEVDASVPRY